MNRRKSEQTGRAYRDDVMALVQFIKRTMARGCDRAFLNFDSRRASVERVKESMTKAAIAPKTLNRRVSSLFSYFKFLTGAVAELRLRSPFPIQLTLSSFLLGLRRTSNGDGGCY